MSEKYAKTGTCYILEKFSKIVYFTTTLKCGLPG